MGADLVFSWFAIKRERTTEKGLKEIKEKMLKAVEKLNIKDLSSIESSIEDNSLDAELELEMGKLPEEEDLRKRIINTLENNENKMYVEASKRVFKKIIEDTFDSINGGYRDVGEIIHKGEVIYISGGMSWGDLPTDSCGTFEKFNYLPKKILMAGGIR